MANEKLYTAKEAAQAVLAKTQELLAKGEWNKIHKKLEGEGYSKKEADKIDGSIKAKVEKNEDGNHAAPSTDKGAPAEKDQSGPDGVQKQPDPRTNPKEIQENGNPAPGALPQNQEKFSAELKGHLKLAKFVGRMEAKRASKNSIAKPAPELDKAEDAIKMSGKSGMLASKETGNEMGVHTKGNRGASQGISSVGARLRDVPHVSAKEGKNITQHVKESHKTMLSEMKSTPKPKLPG